MVNLNGYFYTVLCVHVPEPYLEDDQAGPGGPGGPGGPTGPGLP